QTAGRNYRLPAALSNAVWDLTRRDEEREGMSPAFVPFTAETPRRRGFRQRETLHIVHPSVARASRTLFIYGLTPAIWRERTIRWMILAATHRATRRGRRTHGGGA